MLQQVQLKGMQCFGIGGAAFGPLLPVNLVFGPNGSGKTSISRALHDPKAFEGTDIQRTSPDGEILVYNRDYVSRTFGTSDSLLPGIFMLGSNAQDLLDRIEEIKDKRAKVEVLRDQAYVSLHGDAGREGEFARLAEVKEKYRAAAWEARDAVPAEIDDTIRSGTKNNKDAFLKKCEGIADKFSSSEHSLEDLVEDARTLFDPRAKTLEKIPSFRQSPPDPVDAQVVLGKRILASKESPLIELIEKLGNEAWVQHGVKHFENSEGTCPFCQQPTNEEFANNLVALFDETYETDKSTVERLAQEARQYQESLEKFIAENSESIVDVVGKESEAAASAAAKSLASEIVDAFANKLEDLASIVELPDYTKRDAEFSAILVRANEKIDERNKVLANRDEQAESLRERCWRAFVRDSLSGETSAYIAARDAHNKSIKELWEQYEAKEEEIACLDERLTELQHQTRTSRKVMESVNRLLSRVGFKSFKLDLAIGSEVEGAYRIVRPDDSLADVKNLSEGERTFITFLYFYHSIQAIADEGEQQDVIAVIDDPISSLDSDIMFIVSSLVRTLCEDIRAQKGRVKQLILLTHNTRFHREISESLSFGPWAKKNSKLHSYFRLRKTGEGISELSSHGKADPVRSIYQSLWDEIAAARNDPDSVSTSLPNTMRRILETYVETVGGINKKEIEDLFPEDERVLCRSLLAWTNSGSHRLLDDDGWETSPTQNAVWLSIFEDIFRHANHERHYEKMLDIALAN